MRCNPPLKRFFFYRRLEVRFSEEFFAHEEEGTEPVFGTLPGEVTNRNTTVGRGFFDREEAVSYTHLTLPPTPYV